MNTPKFTPGPWYWHTDSKGAASLRTPDRGNLIVMDACRKGMGGATFRLAWWNGLPGGQTRERMGGILEPIHAEHPDAVLIAAAPEMFAALQRAESAMSELLSAAVMAPHSVRQSTAFNRGESATDSALAEVRSVIAKVQTNTL